MAFFVSRNESSDRLLEQHPDMYEELVGETERLLTDARYEVAYYRQWLTSRVRADNG